MRPPLAFPPAFEREHGCTEVEWLRWLPGAVGTQGTLAIAATSGRAEATLAGGGTLAFVWQTLPPRRIALIRVPRLHVRYRFDEAVEAATRASFMQAFDLFMQRGGG
jgi:hypothetical protein